MASRATVDWFDLGINLDKSNLFGRIDVVLFKEFFGDGVTWSATTAGRTNCSDITTTTEHHHNLLRLRGTDDNAITIAFGAARREIILCLFVEILQTVR